MQDIHQWYVYKRLEHIPGSVPEPPVNHFPTFTLPLRMFWRSFLDAVAKELSYEQQLQYLERCLEMSDLEQPEEHLNSWQKLWTMIN